MFALATRMVGSPPSPIARQSHAVAAPDAASQALALQRIAGNRAVCALQRIPVDVAELERQLEAARKALKDAARVAEDIIEAATDQSIRARPEGKVSENWIRKRLGEIANAGGKDAAGAQRTLDEIERLRKEVGRLKDTLEGIRPTPQRPHGSRKAEELRKHRERKAAGKASGGGVGSESAPAGSPKVEQPGGKQPPKPGGWDPTSGPPTHGRKGPNYRPAPMDKPPKLPAQPPGPTVAGGAGGTGRVVTDVGEAAGRGTLKARVAARVGWTVLDALVPSPLDAFELMIMFLSSYEEAREAIRERSLRNGFAVGWAAYLVIPRWEWAKWFGYSDVFDKSVETQILGAVGIKENAFNEGLVRGFIYGEKHSTAQANRARQRAYEKLLEKGYIAGSELDNGWRQFGREDVWAFASVMRPAARAVLEEAERRKAARERAEAAERRKKEEEREHQRLEAEVLSTR